MWVFFCGNHSNCLKSIDLTIQFVCESTHPLHFENTSLSFSYHILFKVNTFFDWYNKFVLAILDFSRRDMSACCQYILDASDARATVLLKHRKCSSWNHFNPAQRMLNDVGLGAPGVESGVSIECIIFTLRKTSGRILKIDLFWRRSVITELNLVTSQVQQKLCHCNTILSITILISNQHTINYNLVRCAFETQYVRVQ